MSWERSTPPWLAPALVGALLLGLFVGSLVRDPAPRAAAPVRESAPRAAWAVEHRAAVLAGGQRLSWITVPSPQLPEDPLFDIHCLVLEGTGGAALSMVCPGAEQGAFGPAPAVR